LVGRIQAGLKPAEYIVVPILRQGQRFHHRGRLRNSNTNSSKSGWVAHI
jgi:hypothetical protein